MQKKRMNVLWLMSDQHNANCMGGGGHPDVRTPNLDAIAERGALFSHAYCNNPICAPSRSSFLSGQYVKSHGITGNFVREVRSKAPNLGRLFRENGYETALIGKAHLPYQWVVEGFDYIRFSDLSDAAPDDPASCHYFNDLVEADLADLYDQGRLNPGEPGYGNRAFVSRLAEEYSLEAWTGRKAVEFLEQRDSSNPFFLKVSFQRPHDPYAPPAERMDEYDPEALSLPDNACDYLERKFAGKPKFQQEYIQQQKGMGYPFLSQNRAELKEQMAAHFTLITMIDDAIGTVLDALKAQGELENTVIVYTADHGDFAGEHGLMLKNLGIYESIHRVPLLIAGPGVPAGTVRDMLVESVDLYPTLADLAGLSCEPDVDGVSRVGELVSGEGGCDYAVCEWEFAEPQSSVCAIRDGRYRFVFYDEFPQDGELYDLHADPGELNNLFHDPGVRDVIKMFRARMDAFLSERRHVYRFRDDEQAVRNVQDQATILIHQKGKKWSEVCKVEDPQRKPAACSA